MDLHAQAQQAFRSRDFAMAEQLLLKCLEQTPNDAVLLMRLGQVHMAQGNFEESFDYLRTSQKQDPHNQDVYRSIGMAIRMSGMIDLGISYLGIMLTYAPLALQPQIHLTLAEFFAVKGDHISLKNSLLLLAKLPSDNPRMEIRLCLEVHDREGIKRIGNREPALVDLAQGLFYEQTHPQRAIEFLLKSTCADFWEADLALYRLTGSHKHIQDALGKASKTAEVILEVVLQQEKSDGVRTTIERIAQSPLVFDSVRRKAQQIITDQG